MSDRHQILNDREFWERLEFDSCRWIENANDAHLKRFWIDGFLPEKATNTKFGVDVQGVAWVGAGPRKQWPYGFVASLPQKMLYQRCPQYTIQQLTLDEKEQVLRVVLLAARTGAEPDTPPNGAPAPPIENPTGV
jgi:hypothetical protein